MAAPSTPPAPRSDRASSLVVIPTYDERETLPVLLPRVLAETTVDVLVVDDNSPDGTGEWADGVANGEPRLRVMHRPGKQGLGAAYRAGLGWGMAHGYDLLVEMDADLSHDPSHLATMLSAALHADLVLGSRYVTGGGTENWPWHRRALSSGGNAYVRLLTGLPVNDATSGFRVFHRHVLEEIDLEDLTSEGYSFQLETVLAAHRAGFAITEVPITFVERTAGASKISRRIVVEAMARVLAWAAERPRHPDGPHPRSVATGHGPAASSDSARAGASGAPAPTPRDEVDDAAGGPSRPVA